MEGMQVVAVIVIGFLVRLGIPIAVTALLAWALRRLDARWEAEAEARRTRIEAMIAEGAPCWEVHNCPEASRRNCPACAQPEIPCWEHFRDRRGNLREDCAWCAVFRRGTPVLLAA